MRKIYPKEWLELHPYDRTNSVDQYYTRIANQVLECICHTGMIDDLENEDQASHIGLSLAAWFEDIVSETGIWQAFTTECRKRHGAYLPFYPVGNDYYPDEPNLEDIRFLLWHHLQTIGKANKVIVDPENPRIEKTATLIYNLLSNEYETAPENERMQELLLNPAFGEDDFKEYRTMLEWFHYHCYFNTENMTEFWEMMEKLYEDEKEDKLSFEHLQILSSAIRSDLTFNGRRSLLSLTSPEWLARIWRNHPHSDLWAGVKQRQLSYYLYEGEDEKHMQVSDLCQNGEKLNVNKSSMNPSSDSTKDRRVDKTVFACTFAYYGSSWWQCGTLGRANEIDTKLENEITARAEELKRSSQKASYHDFMRGSGGKYFVFCRTKADIQDFLAHKVGYKKVARTPIPDEVGKDGEGFLLTSSPLNGSHIIAKELACIKSPDNPFYNETVAKERAHLFMLDPDACTYDFSCIIQDMGLLPDAQLKSLKGEEYGQRFLHDNAQFLTDYFHHSCREKDFPSEKELNEWKKEKSILSLFRKK